MLETQAQDFQWFKEHYKEISQKYGNCYVVIKEQKILGTYPTYADGVRETEKTEELGTFIVQQCNGDETGYTGYIASTDFVHRPVGGAA